VAALRTRFDRSFEIPEIPVRETPPAARVDEPEDHARTLVRRPRGLDGVPAAVGPAAPSSGATIIPFTKPRAIAAIAAADPKALATAPASDPARPRPERAPALPVATGWTPPRGVNAVAQGEPRRAPAATPPVASASLGGMTAVASSMARASAQEGPAPIAHPAASPPRPWPRPESAPIEPSVATALPRPRGGATALATAGSPVVSEVVAGGGPEQPAAPARWAEYAPLGLGPPAAASQRAAKLIVSAYRLLGFGILSIVVVVLVGYIATTAFYYFSDSWIAPVVVSPTDERVVALQAQLGEQQSARDRIADELQQAERAIAAQQTFQAEFARAIRLDLEGRKLALGRIRALANAAGATRSAIRAETSAYATASRQRMDEEFAAGLIDRGALLNGKYQLAQISSSNLSLAERQAEFETRAAELEAQTRSLNAVLANVEGTGGAALSYEVLRIQRELQASRLELAKSIEARDTLRTALARQDKLVQALRQSTYLRAAADGANVAFVPYGNLDNVGPGTEVFGCKIGMLVCSRVGVVREVLAGEVQFQHPHREQSLRGQMALLALDPERAAAAADDVLFLGGKPLLF
jgi:hypothetical protein